MSNKKRVPAVAVIGSNPLNGIEILKQELKNLKEIQNTPYKADVNMEPVSSNKNLSRDKCFETY